MRFDDKDLLKAMGLKVGDIIECGYTYEIKQYNNQIKCVSIGQVIPNVVKLKDFIGRTFEKVEQKIWARDIYKLGEDKAYYLSNNGVITWLRINKEENLKVLDRYIYFTKRKYAEEYLEELKKFNKEYKKNN